MRRTAILAIITVLLGQVAATPAAVRVSPQAAEFFEKQVRPILAENCFACHGPKKQKADLRLDSRAAMLEGGDSGAVIVPGKPDRSILIQAVRQKSTVKMPPDGKLTNKAIQTLTAWVKMGAPWPGEKVTVPNKGTKENPAWKTHWAFQPVKKPLLAAVKKVAWTRSPIDYFVLAKLEASKMEPAKAADRRTLIRRAAYDLTGLPPTAEEIIAFEADRSKNAFAKVIDRLLASPRYGERWGRYWLDVARYADTKGYVFTQERRFPYAYTYRDYVIRAFNEDLPYDQFLVHQLAADLLPPGKDNRPLAALGFLTVGRRFLNNPHDIIDDRIDVVARGMLGLTVACARCHDHKFDPIPTRDYYSLYGVFASSFEPADLPLLDTPKDTPAYKAFVKELQQRQEKLDNFAYQTREQLVARLRGQVADYLVAAHTFRPTPHGRQQPPLPGGLVVPAVLRWRAYLNARPNKHQPIFVPWHAFAALPPREFAARAPALAAHFSANADPQKPLNPLVAAAFAGKPPASLAEVARKYGALFASVEKHWQKALDLAALRSDKKPTTALTDSSQEALRRVLYAPDSPLNVPVADLRRFVDRSVRDKLTALYARVERWKVAAPGAPPRAMVLRDLPHPVTPHVLLRGNPNSPGPVVPRQFLAVLAGAKRRPFTRGSGRLELARAIIDRGNPLTARVMVNRIWLHHFGAGLVRTPSDFGLRSDPPTHPELLDYLAWRFMADGWSMKKMHRLIMLSATYQQVSDNDPGYGRQDPDNHLLWKVSRRRLDFEAMRDSLLAVSGKLDLTVGGRPVDLTRAPFSSRRTVYGFIDRQNLPGLYRTFDFASPDSSSPQRHTTTVPQQALFLMNSPFVIQQVRHVTARKDFTALVRPEQRIQYLYRCVYARAADADEVKLAVRFLAAARAPQQNPDPKAPPPLSAWEKYAQVLLLANEFMFVD